MGKRETGDGKREMNCSGLSFRAKRGIGTISDSLPIPTPSGFGMTSVIIFSFIVPVCEKSTLVEVVI